MFLSFFVLLLNIPSNVNLALWRLCASSRMANLRSVFHSFMAYATLRSVALLFGNHRGRLELSVCPLCVLNCLVDVQAVSFKRSTCFLRSNKLNASSFQAGRTAPGDSRPFPVCVHTRTPACVNNKR